MTKNMKQLSPSRGFLVGAISAVLVISALAAHPKLQDLEGSAPITPLLKSSEIVSGPGVVARTYTKHFRLETHSVNALGGADSFNTDPQELVRSFLRAAGVDLSEGSTTKVFYNDRTGVLMVRGTLRELDAVETILQTIPGNPPQVTIRVQIVEFPPEALNGELREALGFAGVGDRGDFGTNLVTAVLTERQASTALRALESTKGVDILTAARVTTLSGRQARMAVEDVPVIMDPPFTAPGKAMKARWSKE